MSSPAHCPFCLRPFETVAQLTNHLIFDNCQVRPVRPPDELAVGEDAVEAALAQDRDIVPLS